MIALIALLALGHASTVAAHGYVWAWDIDGIAYEGELDALGGNPNSAQRARIIYDSETKNHLPAVACGSEATQAGTTWDLNAGAKVTAKWRHGLTGAFFPSDHYGIVMEYMAACPSSGCNGVDAASLDWFKISEAGYSGSPTVVGTNLTGDQYTGWASAKIIQTGDWTFTIPSDIASGNYLVRHEIISLQSVTGGGPQSYPVCFQANIKSSGTLQPADTVKFPAVYSTTKDIFSKGFWVGGAENYELPGPRPIGSGSSNASGGNSGATGAVDGSATANVAPTAPVEGASAPALTSDPISPDPGIVASGTVAASAVPTVAAESPLVPAVTPIVVDPVLPVESPAPIVEASATSSLPAASSQTGRRGGRWKNSPPAKRDTLASESSVGRLNVAGRHGKRPLSRF